MTFVPGIKYKEVGNLYGLRNWVEYGLKQSKNELGWADFRVTDYAQIQKWWEIVMSAYLMVSLHAPVLSNTSGQIVNQYLEPIVKDILPSLTLVPPIMLLKFLNDWVKGFICSLI